MVALGRHVCLPRSSTAKKQRPNYCHSSCIWSTSSDIASPTIPLTSLAGRPSTGSKHSAAQLLSFIVYLVYIQRYCQSDYPSYITGGTTEFWIKTLLAVEFLLICFSDSVPQDSDFGKLTLGLWEIIAFSDRSPSMLGQASSGRFGVHEMTGYYDDCQMSGEVCATPSYISGEVCATPSYIPSFRQPSLWNTAIFLPALPLDGFGEFLENLIWISVHIWSDFFGTICCHIVYHLCRRYYLVSTFSMLPNVPKMLPIIRLHNYRCLCHTKLLLD
jgi:hypothetical protein